MLTSRVSVEMVQKTAAIGAPLMVAVSAPTALAVRTADAAGITLAAIARADGFEIFTHPSGLRLHNILALRRLPMSPDRLIYMANQIGKFFQSQGHDRAVPEIADHMKKFWDPRMRKAIFAHLDRGGSGLDPNVRDALKTLKKSQVSKVGTSLTGLMVSLAPPFTARFCRSRKQPAESGRPENAAAGYIPMMAISFTVPLTPAIFAASVAFPVARSTL